MGIFKESIYKRYLPAVLLLFLTSSLKAQQPAFPGAEGFGKYTTGGRGGAVIEVTNLDDDGPGSLRAAIRASGPRTIVFRVSGTIHLRSTLTISNGDLTIAGQTAPGDGITLANYNLRVNANNIIIRFIRSRLGDAYLQEDDAFTCIGRSNIIIDHCSFSWSVDEAASAYGNTNFTMQWCIISESLYHSVHSKGDHGYGGIWGGSRASFHHNLLAHHTSRNPRFNGARYYAGWDELTDHRNNVIYNWGFNSAYGGEPSEQDGNKARINMVKNYYKHGPATRPDARRYRIVAPDDMSPYGYSHWHIDSNVVEGYPEVFSDNWLYGVQGVTESQKNEMRSDVPFEYEMDTLHTAEEAYAAVLAHAGASIPHRDTIDRRIIAEVLNGTATFGSTYGANTGIIDSQDDVGGWPTLYSARPPMDSDQDGMPDAWELSAGLNPYDPEDRNSDRNGDGYTNLEEYINSIAPTVYFIYPPSELTARLLDFTVIGLNWQDNSDDESGFLIERNDGSGYVPIHTTVANETSFIDGGLEYGTSYSYRISSFNDADTSAFAFSDTIVTPGETDPPLPASNPYPAHQATWVELDPVLSWKKGMGTENQNLFLGETNPPEFVTELTDTFYQPPANLLPAKKYYWRINTLNSHGETTGELWSFVTGAQTESVLAGHWPLESANVATDLTVFENHGICYNFQPFSISSNGAVDKALIFNGLNQYVRVPHHPILDFDAGSFSIAFWLRQDPGQVNRSKEYRYVIKGSNIRNENLGRSGRRYEVYYNASSGQVRFAIDDDVTKSQTAAGEQQIITNIWVHLTAIRNTTDSKLKFFVNGSLMASTDDITGSIAQEEDLYFGYDVDYESYHHGYLDDIRLYNYALSQSEIDELVAMGPVSSIEKTTNGALINVFPNPATKSFMLTVSQLKSDKATVTISDMTGKNWYSETQSRHELQPGVRIDLSGFAPGIYFIRLTDSNSHYIKKLMVGG